MLDRTVPMPGMSDSLMSISRYWTSSGITRSTAVPLNVPDRVNRCLVWVIVGSTVPETFHPSPSTAIPPVTTVLGVFSRSLMSRYA